MYEIIYGLVVQKTVSRFYVDNYLDDIEIDSDGEYWSFDKLKDLVLAEVMIVARCNIDNLLKLEQEALTAGLRAYIQRPCGHSSAKLECSQCGVRDCPEKDPLHYHHNGCPSCIALGF